MEEMIILCAVCGSEWTHHRAVDIHERACEDAPTASSRVYGDGAPRSANPSSRRDGLVIRLYCEECDATTTELAISQHKGQTFLERRAIGRAEEDEDSG